MPATLRDVPDDYLRVIDAVLDQAAPAMRKAIIESFEAAGEAFLELLKEMPPHEALAVVELWGDLSEGLIGLYGTEGPMVGPMIAAGQQAVELVDATWSLIEKGFTDRVATFLEDRGARRVVGVVAKTKQAIAEVVERSYTGPQALRAATRELIELPALGLDPQQMKHFEKLTQDILVRADVEDWTASQIQFALDQHYKGKLYHRGRRIAITEASDSANWSIEAALQEAVEVGEVDPEEVELEWVARVLNTCPICEAMDGVRRPITGGLFVSRPIASGKLAGQTVSLARPTAHPHCYCGIRTVLREEKRWRWKLRLVKGIGADGRPAQLPAWRPELLAA